MTVFKVISCVGLGLTVVPSFLVFTRVVSWETHAALMLVGAVLWFATAPFWMLAKQSREQGAVRADV